MNRDQPSHNKLTSVLQRASWLGAAQPIYGNSRHLLERIPTYLTTHTVFLYLDPFGLKGCEFSLLEPFLRRDQQYSTEIILTMNMPVVHRLAARKAFEAGRSEERLLTSYHNRLTQVFGGDYWKTIMWQPNADAEVREHELMQAYCAKLRQYLPVVGSCPVRQTSTARIKYFIVFASRHRGTMLLLNDVMANAYFGHMHEAAASGTLFAGIPWTEMYLGSDLEAIVVSALHKLPSCVRSVLWEQIVLKNFMRFTESQYLASLKRLAARGTITYAKDPNTGRQNRNSILALVA